MFSELNKQITKMEESFQVSVASHDTSYVLVDTQLYNVNENDTFESLFYQLIKPYLIQPARLSLNSNKPVSIATTSNNPKSASVHSSLHSHNTVHTQDSSHNSQTQTQNHNQNNIAITATTATHTSNIPNSTTNTNTENKNNDENTNNPQNSQNGELAANMKESKETKEIQENKQDGATLYENISDKSHSNSPNSTDSNSSDQSQTGSRNTSENEFQNGLFSQSMIKTIICQCANYSGLSCQVPLNCNVLSIAKRHNFVKISYFVQFKLPMHSIIHSKSNDDIYRSYGYNDDVNSNKRRSTSATDLSSNYGKNGNNGKNGKNGKKRKKKRSKSFRSQSNDYKDRVEYSI